MIVSLEALGTNAYNRYALCPAGQKWIGITFGAFHKCLAYVDNSPVKYCLVVENLLYLMVSLSFLYLL